jgi:hypothetical protein
MSQTRDNPRSQDEQEELWLGRGAFGGWFQTSEQERAREILESAFAVARKAGMKNIRLTITGV